MIWGSFRAQDSRTGTAGITKGWLLLTLSLATSIDALVVGLSFAFLALNIALASLTIGVVAFTVTAIAFSVGATVGKLIGSPNWKHSELVFEKRELIPAQQQLLTYHAQP